MRFFDHPLASAITLYPPRDVIKRFFSIVLTAMSMLAIALLSAFIAMRVAIHGREVTVPAITGLSLPDASREASRLGLSLRLEDRFYSTTTPSGHLLGQSPKPGAIVRREWPIRVTESLGPQQVAIPDLVGMLERPASLALRKVSLEVGTVSTLPAPGDPGLILAQTPPPNAEGIDRPSVALLLSAPLSSAPEAFVAPAFTGLTFSAAQSRAAALGLRVYAAEPAPTPAAAPATPAYQDSFFPGQTPASTPASPAAPAPPSPAAIVTGQVPQSGHRVVRGEAIRLLLAH